MRTRVLLACLALAGAAWLSGDRLGSWVRPVALAGFAGALALLLWPRFGTRTRRVEPEGDGPEVTAQPEPTAKEVWDALDRGEDLTSR